METLPINKPPEDNLPDKLGEKPLSEHFRELRQRILWCVGVVGVIFFVIFTFYSDQLMELIVAPVKKQGVEFIYVGLADALGAQTEISLICSAIIASPFLFWQIWAFVKPALYPNEKRRVLFFFFASLLLFVLGVCFGYLVVFLSAITFFVYIGKDFASPLLAISNFVSFLFGFVVPFGLVFEMPVLCYILSKLHLVTAHQLIALRKYIILLIFIIAAILTPPDVLSQVLMALPMLVLYQVGIIVVKLTEKKANDNSLRS